MSEDEEEVGDRGVEEHVLVPLLLSVTNPTHINFSRAGVYCKDPEACHRLL